MVFRFAVWGIFVLSICSCVKGDKDTEPPQVEIISWSPIPVWSMVCDVEDEVIVLDSDDSIVIDLKVTDNEDLSQIKIDIHENFDCHGHRSNTEDWLLQDIRNISGSLFEDKIILKPPLDVTSGNYHLGIFAVDLSGNVSDRSIFYNLRLRNVSDTIAPILDLIQPVDGVAVRRGDSINFSGVVSDNRSLRMGGNAEILVRYRRKDSSLFFTATSLKLSDVSDLDYQFSLDWNIHRTLLAGEYIVRIWAYDGVRNESEPVTLSLTVLP